VKLDLPKDIQALMILDGAKLAQHHQQLVVTGCNFECKDPNTDAPRLYVEIVAGLQKVAGQHQALLGGDGGAAMFSTNEVFLASNQGKELVQATARKARRRSSSEGEPVGFKCWYCEKIGHAKRDCPELIEDKKVGAVKRHPWKKADFKRKEEDRKKKSGKDKLEKSQGRKTGRQCMDKSFPACCEHHH
jgi:hypothetical protein